MAAVISGWLSRRARAAPAGRWAVTAASDGRLLGGVALLPLPPERSDLEIGWQLDPAVWGHGYAAEAGHAVAHHAFESGVEELFAVVRPRNERGARTATSHRHGVGRRDREVLRPAAAGLPAPQGRARRAEAAGRLTYAAGTGVRQRCTTPLS